MAYPLLHVATNKRGEIYLGTGPYRDGMELEGKTKDLPASLAPKKLIQIVSEKETNFSRVFANPDRYKFLQANHRTQDCAFAHDILETYVKVFLGRRPKAICDTSDCCRSTVLGQSLMHLARQDYGKLYVHVNGRT
jgi:hypothetical protein